MTRKRATLTIIGFIAFFAAGYFLGNIKKSNPSSVETEEETVMLEVPSEIEHPEGKQPTEKQKRKIRFHVKNVAYEQYDEVIYVDFSHNFKFTGDMQKFIQISPMPKNGIAISKKGYGMEDGLTLRGDFAPNTVYKIQVLPGIMPNVEQYNQDEIEFVLEKDIQTFAILTKDFSERIGFDHPNENALVYPLYASGEREIPIEYRRGNIPAKLKFEIYQPYENSLQTFLDTYYNYSSNRVKMLKSSVLPVNVDKNQKVRAALDLDKVGLPRKPGFYLLKVHSDSGWERNSIKLVVTNLALQAVSDDTNLKVAVSKIDRERATDAVMAVENATVKIVTKQHQTIGTARTDKNGCAAFKFAELKGNMDERDYIQYIFVESADGKDKTFYNWNYGENAVCQGDASDPLTTGDVKGNAAFVYTDRAIYRPGETVTAFAMVRNNANNTLAASGNTPAVWCVSKNCNTVLAKADVKTDDSGLTKFQVKLPDTAATGYYAAELKTPGKPDNVLGSCSFTVAEYVPDELKLTVRSKYDEKDGKFAVSGNAQYYFGTPLANQDVSISLTAAWTNYTSKKHPGFSFRVPVEKMKAPYKDAKVETEFNRGAIKLKSDDKGLFAHIAAVQPIEDAVVPMQISGYASVSGGSGRAVTEPLEKALCHFAKYYIGIKEGTNPDGFKGKRFQVKVVTPKDEDYTDFNNLKLTAKLSLLSYSYQVVVNSDGTEHYEWKPSEMPVSENVITAEQLKSGNMDIPIHFNGHYILRLTDEKGRLLNEYDFWYYAGAAGNFSKDCNEFNFKLNKDVFQPGDVAELSFPVDIDGETVVFTGSKTVDNIFRVPAKRGLNVVKVQIPADCDRGTYYAYVTTFGKNNRDPMNNTVRMYGLANLKVDQSRHKLDVKITPITRGHGVPEQDYEFKIQVTNAEKNIPVPAAVNIWAVDEGILALTNYKTPDPFKFFYGFYNCHYKASDYYSMVHYRFQTSRKLFGGGDEGNAYFNANREMHKDAAVFLLDTVKTDAQGNAHVKVKLPKHSGSMRIMAVATSANAVGNGEQPIIVRDAITLKVSQPRVLAGGDTFTINAVLINHDSDNDNAKWSFTGLSGADALTALSGKIQLPKGGKPVAVPVTLKVKADADKVCGKFTLKVGNHQATEDIRVVVRAPYPRETKVTKVTVQPGAEQAFVQDTPFVRTVIGSPVLTIQQGLEFLNEYPYGCLEQTVSRAFPLLAVKPLVDAGLLDKAFAEANDTKINNVKQYLTTLEYADQLYKMWPCAKEVWNEGSIYTWHFLLEANACDYPLDETARNAIEKQLANQQDNAYSIYLLSLMDRKRAAQYAEVYLLMKKKANAFDRFLACVTFIRGGHAAEGMKMLQEILEKPFYLDAPEKTGLDTVERRLGLALWILCDIIPDSPVIDKLADEISTRSNASGHWYTTHNNAWCVMGLAKYAQIRDLTDAKGTVTINGKTEELNKFKVFKFGEQINGKVVNTGKSPLYLFKTEKYIPAEFTPKANGFAIHKEILNNRGESVTKVKQGDMLTVKITVTANAKGYYEDMVLCDLLPGGLEIEDATLKTRVSLQREEKGWGSKICEKRYDRMVVFADINAPQANTTLVYTYHVRAVTSGKFTVPPVLFESMYAPDLGAASQDIKAIEVE